VIPHTPRKTHSAFLQAYYMHRCTASARLPSFPHAGRHGCKRGHVDTSIRECLSCVYSAHERAKKRDHINAIHRHGCLTYIAEMHKLTFAMHYRRSFLCRVPTTHGERAKTHGKYFTVSLRTAHNTRQRTPRQTSYAVCFSKNARRTICRVLP
jgi:hypothetical protein